METDEQCKKMQQINLSSFLEFMCHVASILNQMVKKLTGFGLVLNQTKSHLVFYHEN